MVATLPAIALTNPSEGVYIFDLGQTITGWSRIRVQGAAGTTITLKHGTSLYADGTLDARSNLYHLPDTDEEFRKGEGKGGGYHHAALQEDHYTLKGGTEETWEPRFTLHSFRYVEVTGYPGTPTLASLDGRVVHNDVRQSGRFTCSNELYNQIHSNVHWTLRGSLQGFPQDAADRSERQGWLGDPGYIAEDYLYNFHTAGFWTKWLDDIQDSQMCNGDLPIVSPIHWRTTYDAYSRQWPDWSSTYPLYLWHVYRHYDDQGLLEKHYASLKKMVDRYATLTEGHIMHHGLGDHMEPQASGVSSFTPQHTPMALTSTAYYHFSVWVLAQAAQLLGKEADAATYRNLADEIKAAFNRAYLDLATNQYGTGSQTSNAIALHLNLVPEERIAAVAENLVNDIRDNHDNHLSTGIMGTAALSKVLPRLGYADVMAQISAQTTFPSWGDQIRKGATTVWETWDGTPESELSLNMKMFCSTEVFFFGGLAGIQPLAPGYKRIAIRPAFVSTVSNMRAALDTQMGTVAVEWSTDQDEISLHATIPANSTAQIAIPLSFPQLGDGGLTVKEGGKVIWQAGEYRAGVDGVIEGVESEGTLLLEVGSGDYNFKVEAA